MTEENDKLARLSRAVNRPERKAAKEVGGDYCSFCGKEKDEVERLIAGPSVLICNECIDECNRILKK